MKIQEILLKETPLPSDWDKTAFSSKTSFAQMLIYADKRAQQVGRGSSRVAFKVNYQGRPTVLKIAVNNRGIAQNQEETLLLDDWMVEQIGITIPMIDHDEENSDRIAWIHTEFAEKISQKQLEGFFGYDLFDIILYLDHQSGHSVSRSPPTLPAKVHNNEHFGKLQDLVVNFAIPAGDLARKANWGLYKGKPVIIDLGYTQKTAKLYGKTR